MTDWNRVERHRAKGYDWEAIAEDPKVEFRTEVSAGTPGRALKALYLERKSKRRRSGRPGERSGATSEEESARPRWPTRLLPSGIVLLLIGVIWTLIALAEPIVRTLLPVVPYTLGVIVVGAVLLGAGFVIGGSFRDITSLRKVVVVGVVLGLVVSGGVTLIALESGIPVLSPTIRSEPDSWSAAANTQWTSSNHPVVFFLGSIACPYCSATSWALAGALKAFGSLTNIPYGSSNAADTFPNTPEIQLDASSFSSNYLSWDAKEGSNPNAISEPALSAEENAYVQAYDQAGNIPFIVIDGIFFHVGTLVDPSYLTTAPGQQSGTGTPLSPQVVAQDIASGQGSVYGAVHAAQIQLEAYLAKACELSNITPPQSVTSDSEVQALLGQIN
ncbi:MAG: DUF929 domain-containing protein [Thermoplasmata archaeon]|nr:DUF929 domain-containing protein [Thermoplasmata archaeon]